MTDWILFEDNHLVIVNKPAGLLSQAATAGDDNALDRVKAYLKVKYDKPGNVYVGLVHRLDRNVSGAMVFARTSKAASRLAKAMQGRRVHKGYLAVVEGRVGQPGVVRELEHMLGPRLDGQRGVMERPDGKRATLRYFVHASSATRTLLAVELGTGRKHQIRAQLALVGHPIVGDPLYGRAAAKHGGRELRRPLLHAWQLGFEHPVRREPLLVTAPVPEPMGEVCNRLQFDPSAPWPVFYCPI